MTQAYFKIDFLKPGKSLVPVKGLMVIAGKLERFYVLFVKQLYRKVSTSVTTLTISFVVVALTGIISYSQVYLPREQDLESKAKEIIQLEKEVDTLRVEVTQYQAQQKAKKEKMAQLKELRQTNIKWKDKLMGIQRSMADKMWLTSLVIKDGKTPIDVVLQGTSFSNSSRDKPLRLIADFINNLVSDPAWHKTFALRDWHISAPPEHKEELVSFELSLEGK